MVDDTKACQTRFDIDIVFERFQNTWNKRFTLHKQILKDKQGLLSLHQRDGPNTLMHYVQAFNALLSLVLMKEK